MGLIEINKNPSARELRWFGVMFAVFFGIIGTVAWWKFGSPRTATGIWIVAGVLLLAFIAVPPVRRLLYLGWMYAAFPIGWTVTHVILALIYFLVFTSIGLIMRLVGRDPIERRFEPERASYWAEHRPWGDPARYFRQF